MSTQTQKKDAGCQVTGPDGSPQWNPTYAEAWIGLLQTHRQLTRELDARLEADHGLTLSGLELLARLAAAPDHWLRLSTVATRTGLSLSRVSRIVDVLEERGLVERHHCPSDARAVNAHLTAAGVALLHDAETTHRSAAQVSFFDRLSPAEVETLALVFARFAPDAAASCPGSS
ncbi:MAG TPA: MarR family winged helix-turn-helix transcriptional regulator [Solirubrobacteraceae bacterium]|jgi:DNA-binding MarR family transcriptional regulator|nr:MarR family winged helix-turn-helix transcriptional regulator [Solirubrobacteraceae bacterium]